MFLPSIQERQMQRAAFQPRHALIEGGKRIVMVSPLLFQGGNVLVVGDPERRERILLISEATLYQNIGLGLSREQVLGDIVWVIRRFRPDVIFLRFVA